MSLAGATPWLERTKKMILCIGKLHNFSNKNINQTNLSSCIISTFGHCKPNKKLKKKHTWPVWYPCAQKPYGLALKP
jgi:hypothetical protein